MSTIATKDGARAHCKDGGTDVVNDDLLAFLTA
jgi:hypothetical protein